MGKEIQRLHFETAVLGNASLPFFNPCLSDVHFTLENVDKAIYLYFKVHDGYREGKYRAKKIDTSSLKWMCCETASKRNGPSPY